METFNSLGNKMLGMIEDRRHLDLSGAAKRDLALSATHLEDALMRYNSACYRVLGTWKRADPEANESDIFPSVVPPAWRGEDGG